MNKEFESNSDHGHSLLSMKKLDDSIPETNGTPFKVQGVPQVRRNIAKHAFLTPTQ